MIRYQKLILLFIILCSCKSQKVLTVDAPLVEIRKTPCFGTCPDYEAKVSQLGKVEFIGRGNVPKEDRIQFSLTQGDLTDLKERLKQADFDSLKDRYYSEITDLPTTYITYHYQGQRKKQIMDYYGAPDRLKQVEDYLEKLLFKYLNKQ